MVESDAPANARCVAPPNWSKWLPTSVPRILFSLETNQEKVGMLLFSVNHKWYKKGYCWSQEVK